jgi:60 kDa SS-A/Ro ribonucleoprotein
MPKTAALKALLAKDKIDDEALQLIAKSGVTWETLISKFGSTKENWELVAPNMGYMALLRNLRNFQEKDVDLKPILARITNEYEVKRSKQLPFRFYSAWKEVSEQKIKRAIAQAFEKSISNVQLDGTTAVMIDLSGSMDSSLSAKSKVSYKDVALVLGAIATKKSENSIMIVFGDKAIEATVNPDDTMMTNIEAARKLPTGWSTNAWLAFDELGARKVDRVILISDMQCYDSQHRDNFYAGYGYGYNGVKPEAVHDKWAKYLKNVNPNAVLYSLDIAAYGTKQTPSNAKNVVLLNGWSDKIIDLINVHDKGDAMISEIKKW